MNIKYITLKTNLQLLIQSVDFFSCWKFLYVPIIDWWAKTCLIICWFSKYCRAALTQSSIGWAKHRKGPSARMLTVDFLTTANYMLALLQKQTYWSNTFHKCWMGFEIPISKKGSIYCIAFLSSPWLKLSAINVLLLICI